MMPESTRKSKPSPWWQHDAIEAHSASARGKVAAISAIERAAAWSATELAQLTMNDMLDNVIEPVGVMQ
jgi:hypothetical protein